MKKLWLLLPGLVLIGVGTRLIAPRTLEGAAASNTLVLSGNIEAHESEVAFQVVQARIVDLPVQEGQWVKAGMVLARLDDSHYRQQLAVAEAALKVQEQTLAAAQPRLEAARAAVLRDRAEAGLRKKDTDRYHVLQNLKVISPQMRDQTDSLYEQAQSAVLRDLALEKAAADDLNVAQSAVESARQNVQMARLTLGYTVLQAPFSGVVVVRDTELGEVVQPGEPVMTLADLDHVWLRTYVSESDLGRIHLGQTAIVTTDTYKGKQYRGRVSFISPEAEFTPKSVETDEQRVTLVYRVKIDLNNLQHELKTGMPADSVIDIGSPEVKEALGD